MYHEDGDRRSLYQANVPLTAGEWRKIKVVVTGDRIQRPWPHSTPSGYGWRWVDSSSTATAEVRAVQESVLAQLLLTKEHYSSNVSAS